LPVLETPRLVFRRLDDDDAPFIVALLNDPDWLRFIGDRGVRTPDDARAYLLRGPLAAYARVGFGLWRVERKADGVPMGICGLVDRDGLDDVDVGFAFLPAFRGHGYAFEAASATLVHARDVLGLPRVVAIVSPDNARSVALLEKLGLHFERMTTLPGDDEAVCVYGPAT
jgi:RimJ/RimL family protein N-acetyltransferase